MPLPQRVPHGRRRPAPFPRGGDAPVLADADPPALGRPVGAWLGSMRSPNTRRAYRRDLEQWAAWLGDRDVGLLTATRAHLDAWTAALERAGRAPAIPDRKRSSIGSFYTYAIDEGRRFGLAVTREPTARARRPYVGAATACLTAPAARTVIRAADAEGPRAGVVVRLLLQCGLRVREVTGARVEDLAGPTLTVPGPRPRRLALPPGVVRAAGRAVAGRAGGPVVATRTGRRVSDSHYRTTAIVGARAGLDLTPARLRDACATLAIEAGAPLHEVQSLLGHTDPRHGPPPGHAAARIASLLGD